MANKIKTEEEWVWDMMNCLRRALLKASSTNGCKDMKSFPPKKLMDYVYYATWRKLLELKKAYNIDVAHDKRGLPVQISAEDTTLPNLKRNQLVAQEHYDPL